MARLLKNPRKPCGLTVYDTDACKNIPLEKALASWNEEWHDDKCCTQSSIDLQECCRVLLDRLHNRERLFNLCRELEIEMDGVRAPGSARAILNAIRGIVNEES